MTTGKKSVQSASQKEADEQGEGMTQNEDHMREADMTDIILQKRLKEKPYLRRPQSLQNSDHMPGIVLCARVSEKIRHNLCPDSSQSGRGTDLQRSMTWYNKHCAAEKTGKCDESAGNGI